MPNVYLVEDYVAFFEYLDLLRESGKTNMFGAGRYLTDEFGLSRREARVVLSKWRETFNGEATLHDRAKAALV